MNPHGIRIVVFDLGGVLVRIAQSWAEAHAAAGLANHRILDNADFAAQLANLTRAYDAGGLSPDQFEERVAAASGGAYTPGEVARVHHAISMNEYPGVGAVVDTIEAAGVETGALSNTNPAHWPRLIGQGSNSPEYPAVARLQHAHASHLLGVAKPDPRIFAAFAKATGFPPSAILFFDDRAENVLGAGNAGWHARRIDHAGDTASQLLRHLGSFGITAR